MIPFAIVLLAAMIVLPACKKKSTSTGGGGEPAPAQETPSSAKTDYLFFAYVNTKSVFESDLFKEIKAAFVKEGDGAWDKMLDEAAKELGGVNPTDIESITACVPDMTRKDPTIIVIVSASKPINKEGVLAKAKAQKPDSRGFYQGSGGPGPLFHFPDDKTLVVLTPGLENKYLEGYAKNRSGWPMTAELKSAATAHTLFATADLSKVPPDLRKMAAGAPAAPDLLQAHRVTLTADLKGKEISAAVRASFADAAAAGKARDGVQQLIGMGSNLIGQFAGGNPDLDLAPFMPALKEAQRALKDLKVEVSGSDLLVAGSYKIDFDIGVMMANAAKKVKLAAMRRTETNNLMQIGLALHNYHSTRGRAVIHGIGPQGQLLANPTQKPLISWRVAILPYIEQDNLYRKFKLDEPWDSEHNKKLIAEMPKIYAPVAKPGKPGYTHLQMVIGPNAMQPPSVSLTDITDGTSNTIAVAQAADPVIWTKPDDIMLPGKEVPKDLKKKFGGQFSGGFNVVMWDGSPRFIRDSVSERTLGLLINPRDGQLIPNDW
ncbi:MAG TPA: DUF1559 domain-containing protein, partial [Gemmata sp.]|nr:DUF1559 domain-containing protein [Gemmata sp.]